MLTKTITHVALTAAAGAVFGLSQPAAAQLVDSAASGRITNPSGGWLIETVPVNGSPEGGQINPSCATIASGGDAEFVGQVDSPCSVEDENSGVTFTVDLSETQCTVHYSGSICSELSPSATFDFHVDGVHSRWINAYSVITGVQLSQNGTLNSGTHQLLNFDDHIIRFRATASATGGFNGIFTDPFVYTVTTEHALVNDSSVSAQLITEGTWTFTNVGATTDGPPTGPSCSKFSYELLESDVWWTYQAPKNGQLSVGLCDSDYDTKLAVYEGAACPLGDPVACNDDSCGDFGFRSQVTLPVVAGQSYLIRVGGYQGDQGEGQLSISLDGSCDADVNGDNVVSIVDLLNLLSDWGPCP